MEFESGDGGDDGADSDDDDDGGDDDADIDDDDDGGDDGDDDYNNISAGRLHLPPRPLLLH